MTLEKLQRHHNRAYNCAGAFAILMPFVLFGTFLLHEYMAFSLIKVAAMYVALSIGALFYILFVLVIEADKSRNALAEISKELAELKERPAAGVIGEAPLPALATEFPIAPMKFTFDAEQGQARASAPVQSTPVPRSVVPQEPPAAAVSEADAARKAMLDRYGNR